MPQLAKIGPELGAAGNQIYGGILYNTEDYNADLQNQAGMLLFDKMRRSDAEVSGGVRRLTDPLVSAEWRIDPAEDVKRGEEIADYVDSVLLKREVYGRGLVDTQTDFIRQAVQMMVTFGFMAFEKVWGVNQDGDQVYAKLAPRLPKSFQEFRFLGPQGEFSEGVQFTWTRRGKFDTIPIPADKLAMFVFGREGDNLWGMSALRSAYPSWDMKRKILWIDAGSLERFGMGVLEMHATEDVTPEEKAEAEKIAREYRSGERQYLYTSNKFEAKFHHPPTGQSRAIESAKYHDQQIERALLVEFMATGTAETGSRAVVASKMDMLLLALQGTAKIVEDGVTQQLVVDLVDRKFGPQDDYPKFRCEDLTKMRGTELTDLLAPLKEKGLIKYDRRLEEFLRQVNDLPDIDDATREEGLPIEVGAPGAAAAGSGERQPNGAPGENADDDLPQAARSFREPPKLSRDPMEHERYVAFAEIGTYLENEPVRAWKVVDPYRDQLIAKIARAAAKADDSQLAGGALRAPYDELGSSSLEHRLAADLFAIVMRAYLRGRASVIAERDRQLAGEPVKTSALRMAATTEDDEEDFDVEPTKKQVDWVKLLTVGFVASMVDDLVRAARDAGKVSRNADRTEAQQLSDVATALRDLSIPQLQADLAGMIGTQFNNGRNEQAQAMIDEVETAYYSAVLDQSTCPSCFSLDGEEHGVGDPEYVTPNPHCDGGDRCRCVTVYVFRDSAQKEAA